MNYEFEYFAQQGWQCPICRRVYSPTTPMCYYCGNEKTVTTTTLNIDTTKNTSKDILDWLKEYDKKQKE